MTTRRERKMPGTRALLIVSIVFLASLATACSTAGRTAPDSGMAGAAVEMFKDPNCGCCAGHARELEKSGLDVKISPTRDLASVKERYGIPQDMRSCHTSVIGGYVVEGHVPIEAIERLLRERPDIDGIALPGMPAGVAGMPGIKQGTWTIYSLKDGKTDVFMKI